MVYKENSKEVDMRKLIPIEEKLNTLFNKSLIPSTTKRACQDWCVNFFNNF